MVHASLASEQIHSTCPVISASNPYIGHNGSVTIFLLNKLVFVSNALIHTLPMNALTTLGTSILLRVSYCQGTSIWALKVLSKHLPFLRCILWKSKAQWTLSWYHSFRGLNNVGSSLPLYTCLDNSATREEVC
jgi:hypothetical protein